MRRLRMAAAVLAMLVGCGPGMGSIGALLTKQHADGRVFVRQVPTDMMAAQAGLEPGDEVLSIEGKDARAMSAQDVHEALVGPIGTPVALTIVRAGQVLRITVRRGPLK